MTDYEEDMFWQEEADRQNREWLENYYYVRMMDELREQEKAAYPLFYWKEQ